MKNILLTIVAIFIFPVLAFSASTHECGAAWEINVGLDASFFKMTREGPVDSAEIKNWALANGLPDVSGGSSVVGNIKYIKYDFNTPPAKKEYVMLRVTFLENENFDNKVNLYISLSRLDPEGAYKSVMSSKVTAKNIASLASSGMQTEINKWIKVMQAILIKELKPTEVTYTLSKHVVDAENPQEIEIKITSFKDKFGDIADNGTQRLFCVDFKYREIERADSIGAKTIKSLLENPIKFKLSQMKQMAERGCIEDFHHCSRPIGRFYPNLTKSFGMYWDDDVLKTKDEKKEQITIVCPINVTMPEPPVMVFMPGDMKHISFRVTTINDEPVPLMLLGIIKINPPSFGKISRQIDITDNNGFNTGLTLKVPANATEGLTGEVRTNLCDVTKPKDLGRDEMGNPIPWDLKAVQPVKISKMPMINVSIKSVHKFDISIDHRFEDEDSSKREYRLNDVDQELTLTVNDARLNKRTVKKDYADDTGFKGTLIEYEGNAVAMVDMSKPVASKDVERHSGVYKSIECGNIPFDFEKHNI